MGSWNQTCCITQLPIEPLQECRVIFTAKADRFKNGDESQMVYATGNYQPLSLPIPAIYDDYGICRSRGESWVKEFFLTSLKNHLINSPSDFELKDATDRENFGKIQISMATGELKTKYGYNVIREDVFEKIKKGDIKKEYVTKIKESYENSLSVETEDSSLNEMFNDFEKKFFYSYFNRFNLFFLRDILEDSEFELNEDIIEKSAEFFEITYKMDMLRKSFGPQNGCGSQNVISKVHEDFYKDVLEIVFNT